MNDAHVELLIRLDEKLDALKEDVIALRAMEKRVSSLEKIVSYGKGMAAVVAAGFGYVLKVLHLS